MQLLITYLILAAAGALLLLILRDFLIGREPKLAAIQAITLVTVLLTLYLTTDFPRTRQSFGGTSVLSAIGIMFVCVVLGIAARYVFYLKPGTFSLLELLRPLVISPIVLLPLIGSFQGSASFAPVQLISLAFLAFQNGFFWVTVLQQARKQVIKP